MEILNEDFQIHDTLNPKLFDTTTNLLLPDVRKQIINIVTEFEDYLQVPIEIADIQLVGSNASYNYTETSDLDVHIIANFELVSCDPEILKALYDAKKSSFNKSLDIKLHGIDVEIYIQDIKSGIASNGIYSVCDNKWVKEPKPIKSITKHNVEKEFEKWETKIKEVLEHNNYEEISNTINMLYLIRHNSIAVDGEYGKGNTLFKEIRSAGYLQQLKDALEKALSKKLSLESLSKGQLVNRL